MICPNGHQNPTAAAFCMVCGVALASEQPPSIDKSAVAAAAPLVERGKQPVGQGRGRLPLFLATAFIAVGVVAVGAFLMTNDDGKDGKRVAVDAAESPQATPKPPLEVAYGECIGGKGWKTLTIGDEGRSLIVDTGSEYGPIEGLACVLGELDTSQAIVAQLESTTAMMGVQEADDDSLHYQFSYHPDNGINMVITDDSTS